ncbi:MAG: two-component regulator propeller domain-containing protein [Bacteroidota bacterium]
MNSRTALSFVLLIAALAVLSGIIGCAGETTAPKPEPRGPVWVVFNTQNSGIASDSINCIMQDVNGSMWFGTDNGASNLLEGSWSNYQKQLEFVTQHGGIGRVVNALAVGKDGSVWFGLNGGGIRRFNRFGATGAQWLMYTMPSLASNFVLGEAEDTPGNVWVGTSQGANEFIPTQSATDPLGGSWRSLTNGVLPAEPIRAVSINPADNSIWFGTDNQGIVWTDGDLNWYIDAPRDKPFPVTSLAFDANNILWVGTLGDWAYMYTQGSFEWMQYSDTSSAGCPVSVSSIVYSVAVDYHGTAWFGTDQGLSRYDRKNWTTFTHSNSPVPNDEITALLIDYNGNLWIGTTNGVAVYNAAGTKL